MGRPRPTEEMDIDEGVDEHHVERGERLADKAGIPALEDIISTQKSRLLKGLPKTDAE